MGSEQDRPTEDVRLALRQYESLFEALPAELGRIRELIASNASLKTQRLGYLLTSDAHALLVRVSFDARLRAQEAHERADDLEASGRAAESKRLRRSAQRIQASLEAYRDTLDEILEQGRREEHTRVERNQRLLGYALAALAGLAAMPLLTGEMDPEALHSTLSALPAPLDGLATVAAALHPWLALVSTLGALTILGLLAVILARFGIRRTEKGTDPVALVGRALPLMRRLAADPSVDGDAEVTAALADAIDELQGTDHRGLKDADEALDAFLVRAELGTRRPVPMRWPHAATLIRYRLDPKAPGRWLGRREYEAVLASAGIDLDVDELDARAAEAIDVPAKHFPRRLGLT